ncbi:MAG: ribosomal-processing cysteine protease Prp [Faecalimonas umbilicata]
MSEAGQDIVCAAVSALVLIT